MIIKRGSYIEIQHARRGKKLVQATRDFDTDDKDLTFWPVNLAVGVSKGVANLGAGDVYPGMTFPCRGSLVQSFDVIKY